MSAIILTAHTLLVLGLIVVVLLQRSDGGALGLGGGGGGGGFMSGRGAANALTRTTSILGACFFSTSVVLAILAGAGADEESIIEELTGQATPTQADPNALTTDDLLGTLGAGEEPSDAPAAAEETAPDLDAVLDSLGTEGGEAALAPTEDQNTDETGEETPQ